MSQQDLPDKPSHVIIRCELKIVTGFPQISCTPPACSASNRLAGKDGKGRKGKSKDGKGKGKGKRGDKSKDQKPISKPGQFTGDCGVLREVGTQTCRPQETHRRRQVEGWCGSSLC